MAIQLLSSRKILSCVVSRCVEACVKNSSNPNFPECAGNSSSAPDGFPIGPPVDPALSWLFNTPLRMRRFLKVITTELFPSIPDIMVSEFGFAEPYEEQQSSLSNILWDLKRADYFQGFLDSILASIHYDKVNVTGAFGWAICELSFLPWCCMLYCIISL